MSSVKKNGLKGVILALVMAGLIVGYYFHLSNREVKKEPSKAKVSAVQDVLLRDLEKNYPPTPKEVVKYHAEISKCFYDGAYTEEEFDALARRARELYDEELKATQTEAEYAEELKEDIAEFEETDTVISSYSTSASTDVDYSADGNSASLYCIYNVRQGKQIVSSNHRYMLRKDENGHWKILGWELDNADSSKK